MCAAVEWVTTSREVVDISADTVGIATAKQGARVAGVEESADEDVAASLQVDDAARGKHVVEVIAKAGRAAAASYNEYSATGVRTGDETMQGVCFKPAEGSFALSVENFAHRHAGTLFDRLVEVDKIGHARTLQGAAKCRFSRAGQTNQKNGQPLGCVFVG